MKNLFYLIALLPSLLFAQIIQDPCTLEPNSGPCMAAVPKYYFDQETQQCTMFTWGGCGGVVPFNSLSECEASSCASTTTVDSCIAVPIDGCFSIDVWTPVCGCDGVTYSNAGYAACNSIFDFTLGECGSVSEIYGCMDESAFNYNPLATIDDDSCIYFEIPGCTDENALNFNSFANVDDGSCFYILIPGCMDESAINFNPLANVDDDSCVYVEVIWGCLDFNACNYNEEANMPDWSCEYPMEYYDCNGICLNDSDTDNVCDELDNCIAIENTDQADTDNDGEGDLCDYDDGLSIDELHSNTSPLIKMVDILGREYTQHPKGKILFYIYNDQTVKKKVLY